MNRSNVLEFNHQRTEGLQRTYKVTLNVTRLRSGTYAYKSWVHHEGKFKGNGIAFPLVSTYLDDAVFEARGRVEAHIEQLTGVSE